MFRIDPATNSIKPLEQPTFSALNYTERNHLQEWLADYPQAFGEELLIIQKEFSGFGETNERLDLLALDKEGNLVIIENKLDDSGKDVMWQCLKYASYASSLTKAEIAEIFQAYLAKQGDDTVAEDAIAEFIDNGEFDELELNLRLSQRLFFVARQFRKEVTSTAIWLLQYNVHITCFEVCVYVHGGDHFLRLDQIIPTVQEQDFAIRMAEKVKEEAAGRAGRPGLPGRQLLRERFWTQLLPASNLRLPIFNSISPSKASWLAASTGISYTSFVYSIGKGFVRVELYIDRPPSKRHEVEEMYTYLLAHREVIETSFGESLTWEAIPKKRASRIKAERNDIGLYNESEWPTAIDWLVETMSRFSAALQPHLQEVATKLS